MMPIQRHVATLLVAATVLSSSLAAQVWAQDAAAVDVWRQRPIAVDLGLSVAGPMLGVEALTPLRIVFGVGGGITARGETVAGHVAYHIPLTEHWALRPGARVMRGWWKTDGCSPPDCTYDFVIAEAAIRYQGPSGFVFEYGLPLFAWLPVADGPNAQRLQAYSLTTPDLFLMQSVIIGFAF